MTNCINCQKLQAELEQTRKQMAIRLDRDGFTKMASVAFFANLGPHRNMPPEAIAKQCFQWAHIMWEELQRYREAHGNE